MKKPALFLSAILFPAWAWTATTVQTGDWSNPATWGGAVPTAVDNVDVGHLVTLDITTAQARNVTINGTGTLSFSRNVSSELTLVNGDLTINWGGVLDMGDDGPLGGPIPAGVTATLTLARGSGATRHRLFIPTTGGRFTSRGADKSPVAVATGAVANLQGQTTLEVPAADAQGWSPGDVITIGQTERKDPWVNETEDRVIASTGISGSNLQVGWAVALSSSHVVADGVRVANLTRNVVVRSSGTDLSVSGDSAYILNQAQTLPGGLHAVHTEFSLLGVDSVNGVPAALDFDSDGVEGSISSCTFHDNARPIHSTSDEGTRIAHSVFYRNIVNPYFQGADDLVLEGNDFIFTGNTVVNGNDVRIKGNAFYSSGLFSSGLNVSAAGGSGGVVEGNLAYANGVSGISMNLFPGSHIAFNEVFHNTQAGISLNNSDGSVFSGNRSWENGGGMVLGNSDDVLLAGNATWSNKAVPGLSGIHALNADRMTLLSHVSYDNSLAGVEAEGVQNFLVQDSAPGFDPSGAPQPNGVARFFFGGSLGGSVRGCLVGAPTFSNESSGSSLFFYNADFATGTVRLRGNGTLPAGSSLALDHAQPLYRSTATAARLVRGAGHGLTVTATNDNTAVSQVISVEYDGAQWVVTGSSTGAMGPPFAGNQSGLSFGGQFTMDFLQGPLPQAGDRVVFGLLSGSRDANVSKSLLMTPLASVSPRLTVAPGASFLLRGVSTATAVMSRPGGAYAFVSSGSVTLENARVENTDALGLQLSGSQGVALSSVTFDNIASAGGAYITARDLTAGVTSYNMAFNDTPNRTPFSVTVQGVDAGLRWYMGSFSGIRSGDMKDSDPNQKVLWADSQPPQTPGSFTASQGTIIGEVMLSWTAPRDIETDLSTSTLKGGSFRIFRSTDAGTTGTAGPQDPGVIVLSTTAAFGSAHSYSDASGLLLGVTYYYRLWAADEFGYASVPVSGQAMPWGDLVTPTVSLSAGGVAQGTGVALGVSTGSAVTLTFNKSMSPAAVYGSVRMTQLKDNLGVALSSAVAVSVSSNAAGTVYTVTPPALSGNSTYEVVVGTEAGDAFGNYLASPAALRFTTLMDRTVGNVVTEGTGGAVVMIPPGALAQDGYLTGSGLPASQFAAATRKLSEAAGDPYRGSVAGVPVNLDLFDAAGNPAGASFSPAVSIVLPYSDADGDGVVDGTSPPLKARTLRVHWLDEKTWTWQRLASSSVDPQTRRVTAQTPHFTTFALFGSADTELTGAHAFPNPYRADGASAGITFTGLGQITTIRIYTPQGALVREWTITDSQPTTWNVRNQEGEPVAAGLYLYKITSGENVVTGKLVVVR